VSGDVEILRSGKLEHGFSTWNAIRHGGITEVMVSAVGGDDASAILDGIDARVQEAGGAGLKQNGFSTMPTSPPATTAQRTANR
jgi:hypothetical protein